MLLFRSKTTLAQSLLRFGLKKKKNLIISFFTFFTYMRNERGKEEVSVFFLKSN